MISFTKYSHEVHSEKTIKLLCFLILKQTICLERRGQYKETYLERKTEVEIFSDMLTEVSLLISRLSPYMQIRVKHFVLNKNAAKHTFTFGSLPVRPAVTWALSDPNSKDICLQILFSGSHINNNR